MSMERSRRKFWLSLFQVSGRTPNGSRKHESKKTRKSKDGKLPGEITRLAKTNFSSFRAFPFSCFRDQDGASFSGALRFAPSKINSSWISRGRCGDERKSV